ncbi:MAG TPA: enoyl-CoA hydratase-related protein [Acidimicrobiia bacterium]|nr:enoyl-CoA hydratase-related protein [Acidimicrobiia bacterium]
MARVETGTEMVVAEIRHGVGIVTLNRPERRNALHVEMYEHVPVVLERFECDPEVGCILLTAAGSAFCAGGDVRDGVARRRAAGEAPAAPSIEDSAVELANQARMVVMLHEASKVTITAMNGPAAGAGIGIALATDLRIAAASARFLPSWSRLGFSGDFGGPWFLTRLLGPSRALQLLVDDTEVDATTALELGLVNRVVPDHELAAAAFEWARRIASGPRAAWTLLKENIRDALALDLRDALPRESERMVRSGLTDDHREAVRRWLRDAADPEPEPATEQAQRR